MKLFEFMIKSVEIKSKFVINLELLFNLTTEIRQND